MLHCCSIFSSCFLYVKFHENLGVTLFTLAHLRWIHLLHCTHNTELAFTHNRQTLHGSTLIVMPFIFPRLTFKPMLSKASSHFKNLPLSLLIVSLIRTKSSAYSNSLSALSLANYVTTSTTTAKRKDGSIDHWCITTLTSNNSEYTLILVFVPLYRLITDLAKTSGILFFLIAHSNTLLSTLSKTY